MKKWETLVSPNKAISYHFTFIEKTQFRKSVKAWSPWQVCNHCSTKEIVLIVKTEK